MRTKRRYVLINLTKNYLESIGAWDDTRMEEINGTIVYYLPTEQMTIMGETYYPGIDRVVLRNGAIVEVRYDKDWYEYFTRNESREVCDYRRRVWDVKAIQWIQLNYEQVKDFLLKDNEIAFRKKGDDDTIILQYDNGQRQLKVGDFAVLHEGHIRVYTEEQFNRNYVKVQK